MEYGTGFDYRKNFISTKCITMWIFCYFMATDVTGMNYIKSSVQCILAQFWLWYLFITFSVKFLSFEGLRNLHVLCQIYFKPFSIHRFQWFTIKVFCNILDNILSTSLEGVHVKGFAHATFVVCMQGFYKLS